LVRKASGLVQNVVSEFVLKSDVLVLLGHLVDAGNVLDPLPQAIPPSRLSSLHSQVAVGPVSRPIRTAPGAFDLTNAAIASGSESTTPSRTTDPTWFTTQIDVCFKDTSSPT
jgi:hypothetical protein